MAEIQNAKCRIGGPSSTREFLKYVQISLRECREAIYWLRICAVLELAPAATLSRLIDEGGQIARILGAIVVNTRRRLVLAYGALVLCLALGPFLRFAF